MVSIFGLIHAKNRLSLYLYKKKKAKELWRLVHEEMSTNQLTPNSRPQAELGEMAAATFMNHRLA